MKASAYGIKNLQRITLKLSEWTKSPNQDYSDLKNMYGQLTGQYNRYMGHVVKNVAGVYENPKTVEQSGLIYSRVPAALQKEAMFFLNEQLFTTPQWLLNKNILDNIGANSLQTVSRSQNIVLNRLISVSTFNKLITAEAMDGSKAYTITNLFNDLNRSIFKELNSSTPIDVYRRNLQKMYVDNLIDILKPDSPAITSQTAGRVTTIVSPAMQSDGISIVKAELKRINLLLKNAVPKQSVSLSKYHLQDLSDRINQALNPR
jgi:hypothetical protein